MAQGVARSVRSVLVGVLALLLAALVGVMLGAPTPAFAEADEELFVDPVWQACGTCEWGVGTYTVDGESYDTLVIKPAGDTVEGTLDDWGTGAPPWADAVYTEVRVWKTVHAKTCASLFAGSALVGRRSDLSGLDTAGVTDMSNLAAFCTSLTALDLSPLDGSQVQTMSGLCMGCTSLASVTLPKSLPNVTDLSYLLYECSTLPSLALPAEDLPALENVSNMCALCTGLTVVDFGGVTCANVTDFSGLFAYCNSLEALDLSTLNTASAQYYDDMFEGTGKLAQVTVGETYAMTAGSELFPQEAEGMEWLSAADGQLYSRADIVATRSCVADTYTLAATARQDQTITVTATSVGMGETVSLGAVASGGGALTYASSDETIATVDQDGQVSGLAQGVVTITVTAAGNDTWLPATKTVVFIVSDDPEGDYPGSIVIDNPDPDPVAQTITASNKTVAMGKTVALGATTSGDGALSYVSSDAGVATASATGVVTPVKPGTVTVTITAAATAGYTQATKTVTVTVTKGTQVIKVTTSRSVNLGKKLALGAKRTAGNGKLTYKSSNPKIATVSATGKVTPKKTGKVTITITAAETASYKKATKKVTVRVLKRAQVIKVAAKKTVRVGKKVLVGAKISVGNGKLSCRSSNARIVRVRKIGGKYYLVGVKAGKTTVTITASGTSKYAKTTKKITVTVK